MCLMGIPHTPLYARRAVRTHGNLWRVPITAQSGTDATEHEAFQPLRGSGADCVRLLIRQSIHHARDSGADGGRTAPEEMGRSPIFDKRG